MHKQCMGGKVKLYDLKERERERERENVRKQNADMNPNRYLKLKHAYFDYMNLNK